MSTDADSLERERHAIEPGAVIVVCGLPGVGKSTVAKAIAERVDGAVLRTDVIRQQLIENPVYTADEKRRVYDALFERARRQIEAGQTVVLDGTYRRREYRDRAAALAEAAGSRFELVAVDCVEPVVERRIGNREDDASEADFAVYQQYRDSFEPIEREHATIDNSGDRQVTRRQVAQLF